MSDDKSNTLDDLTATAESAVAELEALKLPGWVSEEVRRGIPAPWAEAQRRAEEATETLRTVATETLFPDAVAPVGADLWADLEHYAQPSGYRGAALAELHGRALETYPTLAAFIRTARVLDLARRNARGPSTDRRDPAAGAVAELVAGVAGQLAGADEFEPAAAILVEALPALRERIATAAVRLEAEAAARARAELAAWFREHIAQPGRTEARRVEIGREFLTGEEISERIESGDLELFDLARHYHLHHPAGGGRTTRGERIFS